MSHDAIRIQRSWLRCAVLIAPAGFLAVVVSASGGPWSALPIALIAAAWVAVLRRSVIELTDREVVVRRLSTQRLRSEEIASLTREPWRRWDAMEVLTFRTRLGRVVRADYPWAVRRMESPAMDRAYHDVAQWLLARQPDARHRTAE